MVKIPRMIRPTSGMTLITVWHKTKKGPRSRTAWRANWRENGKSKQVSLGTADTAEAIKRRDALFDKLRKSQPS